MPFDLQPTLTGTLLELRPLRASDWADLYTVASDPLIWEQHPVRNRHEEAVFKEFFREALHSGGALVAIDRQDGRVVGSSRFHGYDAEKSEIEIGWTFLARSHWGGRHNAEMKQLMLRHAFRFVTRVIFLVGPENRRSRRALEKLGAMRAGSRQDAAGRDSVEYQMVAPENLDERTLFLDASARAVRYLESVRIRPVAPDDAAVKGLRALDGPLPENLADPAEVLRLLDEIGSPATVANSGGRYFGFVNGGSLPVARAANVLAAAWDQNAAMRVMSPTAAFVEDLAIRWCLELFGLPAHCGGGFVTGATMASFSCLAAARHELLRRQGWDVEADGLFGAPPLTVVVGEEVHASVSKALALLGLGRNRVVVVPTDQQGRMRADRLPPLDATTIVCVQAGNVNTGAFDPFEDVCAAAAASGAWVHVDGAFGLWATASPDHAGLVHGLNRAHSWATDAHKWLNVPYDCGIALVRNSAALKGAMQLQAAYLEPGAEREPMHFTPEASRRARGVEVWAALRALGRGGVADLVRRTCRHARRFAAGLQGAGHTVLNEVVLNQVLVAFGSDLHTARVIEAVQRNGVCWCGGTRWKGRTAMRISISSWATTDADVDMSVAAILDAAADSGP